MSLIRVAAIVALLFGGQALGDSTMIFTLGLGGNNHVADWEGFMDTKFEKPASDVVTYASGAVITWHVEASVVGDHSLGWTPNGISNLVFHLEVINVNTGQLVAVGSTQPVAPGNNNPATDGFFSTTNDGHADGLRGSIFGPDPRENAAFARSFGVSGPGRIWDTSTNGGPTLDRKEFPSAAGWPTGTTAPQGKLVGMGAGYSQYTRSGVVRTPGVGGIGSCALPIVPVAEGQMRLPDGCYQLKLCPGTGNNVLRGDFNCATQAPGSFAVAVDATQGDCIEFKVGNAGTCPAAPACLCIIDGGGCPTAAASRRTHGSSGAFDLPIPIDGTPGIEPRKATAGTPQLVLTYDAAPANPGCGGVAVVNGSCTATNVVGNDLIIDLSYSTNACVEVTVGDCPTIRIAAHQGDVDGNGTVNVIDLQTVKNNVFTAVSAANARYDVAADGGQINVIDLQETKNNVFKPAPCN